MNKGIGIVFFCGVVIWLTSGCKAVLPREDSRTKNAWTNFFDAQEAFERIKPHQTSLKDLHTMGFDYKKTANLRILTYLEIMERFIPNASITLDDLDADVRDCIESKNCCQAYELDLDVEQKQRFGNVFLDLFGFKKSTQITGWNFRALVLIKDDLVIYKLRSGQPNVDRVQKKVQPLGPFQELDDFVVKAAKSFP
jgi:hypothetical protein